MAAILACRAMLNHRPLRRGCLIEFLYPTGVPGRWRRASPRPRFAFLNESSSAPDAASPHLTTSSSSLHFSDAWRRPPRCSGRRPRCQRGTAWVAGECSPRGPAVREPRGGASVAVLHASHFPAARADSGRSPRLASLPSTLCTSLPTGRWLNSSRPRTKEIRDPPGDQAGPSARKQHSLGEVNPPTCSRRTANATEGPPSRGSFARRRESFPSR
jgi:hypothetical protein